MLTGEEKAKGWYDTILWLFERQLQTQDRFYLLFVRHLTSDTCHTLQVEPVRLDIRWNNFQHWNRMPRRCGGIFIAGCFQVLAAQSKDWLTLGLETSTSAEVAHEIPSHLLCCDYIQDQEPYGVRLAFCNFCLRIFRQGKILVIITGVQEILDLSHRAVEFISAYVYGTAQYCVRCSRFSGNIQTDFSECGQLVQWLCFPVLGVVILAAKDRKKNVKYFRYFKSEDHHKIDHIPQ